MSNSSIDSGEKKNTPFSIRILDPGSTFDDIYFECVSEQDITGDKHHARMTGNNKKKKIIFHSCALTGIFEKSGTGMNLENLTLRIWQLIRNEIAADCVQFQELSTRLLCANAERATYVRNMNSRQLDGTHTHPYRCTVSAMHIRIAFR